MTSSWLGRACVVVLVVVASAAVGTVKSSAPAAADQRRASTTNRLMTRLCDAILARRDDDVIDDRKRKWGDNTMNSWGKRDAAAAVDVYAASVCELLDRARRRRGDRYSVTTWALPFLRFTAVKRSLNTVLEGMGRGGGRFEPKATSFRTRTCILSERLRQFQLNSCSTMKTSSRPTLHATKVSP